VFAVRGFREYDATPLASSGLGVQMPRPVGPISEWDIRPPAAEPKPGAVTAPRAYPAARHP